MRRIAVGLVLLCAAACSSGHATVSERAQKIEGQVWSPYCPGKLLIDCTTTQAGQLRARITRELRAGRSDAAVLSDIRRDFGDSALARPPSGRGGLLVWLVPIAVFLLGAMVVVFVRRRGAGRKPESVPRATNDPALQRLRDEVRREI